MSEYFRIVRGLEIDENARILQGIGAPGSTPDTDNAPIGSLYLNGGSGGAFTKISAGPGLVTWSNVGSTSSLYRENPQGASPPVPLGDNSVAIGYGAVTDYSAPKSIAIGDQSLARLPGSMVFANGRFGSSGDVQAGKYLLRTVTMNAFATEAFLDGANGSERLVLPDNSTWTYNITVTAHRTDAGDGHAGYKAEGVIYRGSGADTTAMQGAPVKTTIAESNPQLDINIDADIVNGSLRVKVTGQAGKIFRWAILIDTVEVTN